MIIGVLKNGASEWRYQGPHEWHGRLAIILEHR